jgi:regulator of sirC expression with transglutaminase-like and TPR domain
MNSLDQMTWEKLAIEIELLNAEDPSSLMPLLLGLNRWLCPTDGIENTLRTINFMTYELMAGAENLTESERFEFLNKYYFTIKGFQVLELKPGEIQERHLLFKPVVEGRAGAPITIALIYLHLASHLDLPVYLIQLRNHYLLKWVRGGRSDYVDLCSEGRLVSEEDLMQIVARHSDGGVGQEALNILPGRRTFLRYNEDLLRVYERQEMPERLHAVCNVLLKLEPQNNRILGRRALIRRHLGLEREALADLKRYFSFIDRAQAPSEMVLALQELASRHESARPTLLH